MPRNLPYYAVIFTSRLSENAEGYTEMAALMDELVRAMPGFLGMDHARQEIGITVCYWESPEAIANWRNQADHQLAREKGKAHWYDYYDVKIAKVEYEYNRDSRESN